MLEKVLAGIGFAGCVVLLLAMVIGTERRLRWQAALRRALHWRRNRVAARREAEAAIERVRRKVDRDGNVYRPKAFGGDKRRPDDDKLH